MNMDSNNSIVLDAAPTRLSNEAFYGLFIRGQDSAGARSAYDVSIRNLAAFIQLQSPEQAVGALRQMNQGQVNAVAMAYRIHLLESQLAPATIAGRLTALRQLGKAMRLFELVQWQGIDIKGVKVKTYRDTAGPGHDGFNKMFDTIIGECPKQKRDRAILNLLYFLALRRFQVTDLDLCDYAGDRICIKDKGYGEQKSPVSIPDKVAHSLREWLAVRPSDAGTGESAPIFIGLQPAGPKTRLTGKSVYQIVKRCGNAAELKVWPHALRHAAITEALERTNGNLRDVQKFSRHANANTLMLYDDRRKDVAGDISELLASG